MKVVVKGIEYDSQVEAVMIILSQEEKKHIANMTPEATKYCSYPDSMERSQVREFMGLSSKVKE